MTATPDAYVVIVQQDIDTPVGTIAPGTRFLAVPDTKRDVWTLELSLPRAGVGSRTLDVPAVSVRHGSELPDPIERKFAAHADYRFARATLGLGHDSTIQWLCTGYRVTLRTLERWGFTQHEMGVAS